MNKKISVSDIVVKRILDIIDRGILPWRNQFRKRSPRNLISNKPYRGINRLLLPVGVYASEYYLSYKQIKDLGGSIKDSEIDNKNLVTFYTTIEVEDRFTKEKKTIPYLLYYAVWNVEQCVNLKHSRIDNPVQDQMCFDNKEEVYTKAFEVASKYIARENITFLIGADRCCYIPLRDTILIPQRKDFFYADYYYSSLYHECAHSTGHENRLKRIQKESSRDEDAYGREELVAELCAAFLCGDYGINTLEPSASYIKHWADVIRADKKIIIECAGAAQKAADLILDYKYEEPV